MTTNGTKFFSAKILTNIKSSPISSPITSRSPSPLCSNFIRWREDPTIATLNKQRSLSFSTSTYKNSGSPEAIIESCLGHRASLQQINDKFRGPLEKSAQKNTILPFVFLLGNHSSGKSSFVNYVCQSKIQTAGVAPTDDSFTVIVPGPADVDRDGPALIGDPDMGFSGLRTFGPQLIHHTQLKVRADLAIKNFMIVDTPGMIDSPVVRDATGIARKTVMDRGYDFEGVCRWYAERADVILLFFDPDKPGTTGETLSILTNSLSGLDHKLHIILNKADQFRVIHDFARAYGSLCWNLSKVIQRKDLPRIYTMCLPPTFHQAKVSGGPDQSDENGNRTLGQGLIDLERTREEVVLEVLNAPKRRVDNEISRLSDAVAILQMHVNIVGNLRTKYSKVLWKHRFIMFGAITTSIAGPISMLTLGMPMNTIGVSGVMGIFATSGLFWYQSKSIESYSKELCEDSSLETTFKNLYARRINEKDEFTMSLWTRVRDHLRLGFSFTDLQNLEKLSNSDISHLEKISEIEVPNLRRTAAPTFDKN